MWFGVLGRLEVCDDIGRAVRVGGSVRRELLAALLCRGGDSVAATALIGDIWGDVPPRTAPKTLQSHVVRLRDDLGRGAGTVILTEGAGYRLDISVATVDAALFEADLDAGLAAYRRGDDRTAIECLDSGLGSWRAEAYLDFADAPFALNERMRLADLRAVALETRADAALRLGEAATLISELEGRVRREPYRERSWEQLILALYRSGRQADALAAYRMARDRLASNLGVDPGPGLRALETRILNHDPTLLLDPASRQVRAGADAPGDRCPYRGLAGYSTDDASVFVGRERLTTVLAGRLAEPGVVVVAGASGSGKSSVVRAGVVPALRAGALPQSAAWRVVVTTPADGVRAGQGADALVLDQAEELFTVLDEAACADALDRLRYFVEDDGRLVLVLRGDFFAALAEVPWLARYAQREPVLVGRMREDELARVIVEPARRAGVEVADEVVEAILDGAAGQAQPLPLISVALVRAWEHRAGDSITLGAYEASGGVIGAIETTAEAAYARLPEVFKADARRLLVRLAVREGAGWVRSPLPRTSVTSAASNEVLDVLAVSRLISVTERRVELSHDALLEHWPRLRDWLDERVIAAGLLGHLTAATNAWLGGGRHETDLHRGPRLQAALDWREAHPDDLSADESEFLTASSAAADSELREANVRLVLQARSQRRLRRVVAGLAATLVLAVGAVVVAIASRSAANNAATRARHATLSADARRLAALSLSTPDLATSALLAAASYQLQDSSDSRGALLSVLEHGRSAQWRVGTTQRVVALVAAKDGSRLYALENFGRVDVIDTAQRKIVATYEPEAENLIGVAHGGQQLVVNGFFDLGGGIGERLRVLDAATGRVVRTLDGGISDAYDTPTLSQDGRWLVAGATPDGIDPGRSLAVYDATDWSRPARTLTFQTDVVQVAASDQLLLAQTADRTVYLVDPTSMRVVAHMQRADMPNQAQANLFGVATGEIIPRQLFTLSPDGRRLAYTSPSDSSTPLVLDTSRLGGAATTLPAQPDPITTLRFSPDGSQLAVTSYAGAVNVHSARDGSLQEALAGQSGSVVAAAWATTPAGPQLYTGGLDSQVVSWKLSHTSQLVRLHGPPVPAAGSGVRFGDHVFGNWPSQTGSTPVSAERLFDLDLQTGAARSWPARLHESDALIAFSQTPDHSLGMVSIQSQATLGSRWQLWDLRYERLLASIDPPPIADQSHFLTAALSPDGKTAVVALGKARLGVLSLPTGRLRRSFHIALRDPGPHNRLLVEPYMFTPTGQLVIAVRDNGGSGARNSRMGLVDVSGGRLLAQTDLGAGELNAVGWSSDGALLAIGTTDDALRLYNARTLQLLRSAANAQAGYVTAVSFSPDDRTIVTSGTDAAMNFWDVATMVQQGPRITVPHGAYYWYAWYAPNGDVAGLAPIGTAHHKNVDQAFIFPARVSEWLRQACALAGSDITHAQWAHYVGDQPYRHVCGN